MHSLRALKYSYMLIIISLGDFCAFFTSFLCEELSKSLRLFFSAHCFCCVNEREKMCFLFNGRVSFVNCRRELVASDRYINTSSVLVATGRSFYMDMKSAACRDQKTRTNRRRRRNDNDDASTYNVCEMRFDVLH